MKSNINFTRMAQVTFFYCMALIFVFKVKILTFFLICEYLANGEGWSRHCCCHQIGSWALASECCTSWPWPTFSRSRILKCKTVRAGKKMLKYDFYRGWYLQLNGNNEKNFMIKLLKWSFWQVDARKLQTLPSPSDRKSAICHRMAPLRVLCSETLTYIFKVKRFKP